jgi:hypothetical protein
MREWDARHLATRLPNFSNFWTTFNVLHAYTPPLLLLLYTHTPVLAYGDLCEPLASVLPARGRLRLCGKKAHV